MSIVNTYLLEVTSFHRAVSHLSEIYISIVMGRISLTEQKNVSLYGYNKDLDIASHTSYNLILQTLYNLP